MRPRAAAGAGGGRGKLNAGPRDGGDLRARRAVTASASGQAFARRPATAAEGRYPVLKCRRCPASLRLPLRAPLFISLGEAVRLAMWRLLRCPSRCAAQAMVPGRRSASRTGQMRGCAAAGTRLRHRLLCFCEPVAYVLYICLSL